MKYRGMGPRRERCRHRQAGDLHVRTIGSRWAGFACLTPSAHGARADEPLVVTTPGPTRSDRAASPCSASTKDENMSSQVTVPTRTPPKWLNWMMLRMLRTPGLQRWIGEGVALLTFTGRRSGRRYTIPISYARDGTRVTALTKKTRSWWRNFADEPNVELRLAGQTFSADAIATVDDPEALPILTGFLEQRPFDAKAYGTPLRDGRLAEEDARALLPQVVLLRFELSEASAKQPSRT